MAGRFHKGKAGSYDRDGEVGEVGFGKNFEGSEPDSGHDHV